MSDYTVIISQGTIAIGVLVALTNIITEVVKTIVPLTKTEDINRFATIIGILLTLIAGFTYLQVNLMPITWYEVVALVIVGFMVSLASMLGFDKLLSYFEGVAKHDK